MSQTSLSSSKRNELMAAIQKAHDSSGSHDVSIPPNYVKLSRAGNGLYGEVYFCIPANDLTAAVPEPPSQQQPAERLLSKIVVVKVATLSTDCWAQPLADEVAVLTALQGQSRNLPQERHFFTLLDWDMASPNAQWLVSSTSPLCCTMDELLAQFDSMPEDFLWYYYVQLHDALDFLHRKCNPPIAHRDLHRKNVMFTLSHEDQMGLPVLKFIDFGAAKSKKVDDMSRRSLIAHFGSDINAFMLFLDNMIHDEDGLCWDRKSCMLHQTERLPKHKTETFYKLHEVLSKGLDDFDEDSVSFQKKLWEDFGAHAVQQVTAMSESSMKQIRDNFLSVAKPRLDENLEKLEEMLAEPKTDSNA